MIPNTQAESRRIKANVQMMRVRITIIGEGVIVHRLLEVDCVEDFDFVMVAFKQLANLADYRAFGVGNNVGAVHLHKVGL